MKNVSSKTDYHNDLRVSAPTCSSRTGGSGDDNKVYVTQSLWPWGLLDQEIAQAPQRRYFCCRKGSISLMAAVVCEDIESRWIFQIPQTFSFSVINSKIQWKNGQSLASLVRRLNKTSPQIPRKYVSILLSHLEGKVTESIPYSRAKSIFSA